MAFFSGAEGTTRADTCGITRSGVDSTAGLTDFSWACLAALVSIDLSIDRPGGAARAASSSNSLGLLMARGDARQCIQKVMSEGASRHQLLRGCDQPDDLLHAGPVKV